MLEKFKQLGDDRKIDSQLAAFCITVSANNIRYKHLKNTIRAGQSGAYLTVFSEVSVIKNAMDSTFVLPSAIPDMPNDAGISFIAYQMNRACDYLTVQFSRTTGSKIWSIKDSPFESPSPKNPYFWRENSTVHLEGIECVDVDQIIVGLFTMADPTIVCDLDTDIPIEDQYSMIVLMEAEQLLRFGYAVTQERMNDGTELIERINKVQEQVQVPTGPQQSE